VFSAFVIALREGVEGALVVGLLLAALARTGRGRLRRSVFAGLAAAVVAAGGAALLLASLRIDPENPVAEGTLLLVSALFVGSMVVWMARHGRALKGTIDRRIGSLGGGDPSVAAKAGVFLFTFLMVGREGAELVLFLGASALNTEGILTLLGGLAGLALAVGIGVAFARGALRVDLRKFFLVTSAMLLVFAAELLLLSFHEFVEAEVISPGDSARYMRFVGPLVRNRVLFAAAMLLLPVALLLAGRRPAPSPSPAPANPAEERKRRASARSERGWRLGFASLSVLAVGALAVHGIASSRGLELSPPAMVAFDGEDLPLPLAALEEGELRRFGVAIDGRVVRFLLLRTGGTAKSAFDACRLCRDWGYVQQGDHLLCRNCAAEIHAPSLGVDGGCNPIPLPSRVEGDRIVIRRADLEAGKLLFRPTGASPVETDLACPFCGMRFRAEERGAEFDYGGRRYRVCGMEECRKKSLDPARYLARAHLAGPPRSETEPGRK
jgi:high-affinity iron transporter